MCIFRFDVHTSSRTKLIVLKKNLKARLFQNKKNNQCLYNASFTQPLLQQKRNDFCVHCWATFSLSRIWKYRLLHKMLLWRTYIAGTIKHTLCLHVKHPILLSNFKQIWSSSADFHTVPNIRFHENLFSGSGADTCCKKDGHDKAKMRFSRLANAPKNVTSALQWSPEDTILATDAVTALPLSSLDLWDSTFSLRCCRLRRLVNSYWRIERSSCLYLQGQANLLDCVSQRLDASIFREELLRRERQPVTVKRWLTG